MKGTCGTRVNRVSTGPTKTTPKMSFSEFIPQLAVFVGVVGLGSYVLRAKRRRDAETALRAPLLDDGTRNTIDARVESAIRVAREGYRVCPKCGFENLVHRSACGVCGATYDRQTKRTDLSERQQHARRQKEWVRAIDSNCRVVWVHNTANDDTTLRVVRLQAPLVENEKSSVEDTIEGGGGIATVDADADRGEVVISIDSCEYQHSDTQPSDKLMTEDLNMKIQRVVESLEASVAQLRVTTERPSQTNAAAPTLVQFTPSSLGAASSAATKETSTLTIPQDIQDLIALAQCDFPTKLAQFITECSSVFRSASTFAGVSNRRRFSLLTVNRSNVLVDSARAIATLSSQECRGSIRVSFVSEQGIDAGGVYREWFVLVNEQIITPEAGIFTCVNRTDQSFYLNHHSRAVLGDQHLAHFLAAGRILGRALLEGNVTGFHLAPPLLKIILGLPIAFDDLAYYDPDVFKNLTWLIQNDGADALGLDFTVTEQTPSGSTHVVELVPRGASIDVTDANKHEYVHRMMQYLLVERVSQQLFALLKGLYDVIPATLLLLFDAEELDYVVCGSDEIDVDDWERNAKYTDDLIGHPAVKHFWQLVREMSTEERRRLLQFTTGSSRVPPAGFAALTSYDGRLSPFTLHGVLGSKYDGYVRSHACFNRLDLPRHHTKRGLKSALTAALDSEAMGFTTA